MSEKPTPAVQVLTFIFLIGLIWLGCNRCNACLNEPSKPTAPLTRAEKISKQFSAWDGSHLNLTKVIKAGMNDPNSFEHANTTYIDEGDYLLVTETFRGTNAFGGVVPNTITAKVDLDGNVIKIVD